MEKNERGHQKMSEKVVNAALLGLGTVGTGVYKVIRNQEQEMTAKLGCRVKITKILVRNLEKAVKKVEDPSILTTNWDDIAGDPSIDIVIELIGGIEPARTYILSALKAGKNVVTANKDLIAESEPPKHSVLWKRDPGDRRGGAERLFIRGSSCRRNSDHQSAEEQP